QVHPVAQRVGGEAPPRRELPRRQPAVTPRSHPLGPLLFGRCHAPRDASGARRWGVRGRRSGYVRRQAIAVTVTGRAVELAAARGLAAVRGEAVAIAEAGGAPI